MAFDTQATPDKQLSHLIIQTPRRLLLQKLLSDGHASFSRCRLANPYVLRVGADVRKANSIAGLSVRCAPASSGNNLRQ